MIDCEIYIATVTVADEVRRTGSLGLMSCSGLVAGEVGASPA
jgi:hypothetical protein